MPPASTRPPDSDRKTLVVRVFNGVGRLLRRCGFQRPLRADRVLARACRETGLDDWGEMDVREPLERLLGSLEEVNRLTPLGRLLIHRACVTLGKARLYVRAARREHPEVLAERVVRPVFILGLPRTGTTLLQRLLSQDPNGRPLLMWEGIQPWLPGGPSRNDPRIRLARRAVAVYTRHVMPGAQTIHPVDPEGPEECIPLLMNTFRCQGFQQFGCLPGYLEWLRGLGEGWTRRVYEEYRRQLQLLQWRHPARRWVLKCPLHAFGLDALLRLFPDACVVQTHRPLAQVVPSCCSMVLRQHSATCDGVEPRRVAAETIDILVRDILEPSRLARAAHPGRVLDVSYHDLVRDPVGAVRGIYEHFGLPLGAPMEENMRRWLAANPSDKHGKHAYSLEQFGLDPASLRARFREYPERFEARAEPDRC
jgi:hypothetical protein